MNKLKCGFTRTDITPEMSGIYFDGYGFRTTPIENVRDSIYATVCAFDNGVSRYALVSFDVCGFKRRAYDVIIGQISCAAGLSEEQISICATHTHSAPACGVLDIHPMNLDYIAAIGAKAGMAVAKAFDDLHEGSFTSHIVGDVKSCGNRRGQPVIDRRIKCAIFSDTDGKARGGMVISNCHAVVNCSMLLSADYPSVLHEASGDDLPILFLMGRGGDIDPYEKTEEMLVKLGHEISDPVMDMAVSTQYRNSKECDIAYVFEDHKIPMRRYPSIDVINEQIKSFNQLLGTQTNSVERHCTIAELNWLYIAKDSYRNGITEPFVVTPMKMLRIGELIFFFVPFEMLTRTGNKLEELAVSHGFLPENIYAVGCSNAEHGYLPPVEEFAVGGYEVDGASHWYGQPSCSEETEKTLLKWFEDMIGQIKEESKS